MSALAAYGAIPYLWACRSPAGWRAQHRNSQWTDISSGPNYWGQATMKTDSDAN